MARTDPRKSAKSSARRRTDLLGIRQRLYLRDYLMKVAQILNSVSSTYFLGQVKFSESYYYTFVS